MPTEHALSSLIGDIYDCALAPNFWPQTLGKVARVLRCERAILSLNDLHRDQMVISESFGWEPHWLAERDKHLPEIHAVLQIWFSRERDADNPFVASRELPASALSSSAYVRNCLEPLGVCDVAHYFLLRSASHFSEIVLMRQAPEGLFGPREIEVGKLLQPHLRRAVTISNVLDARTIERERLAHTLDALQYGVVLTDRHGAIVHTNQAADILLDQGELLAVAGGVIRAKQPSADRELQRSLRLSAGNEATMGEAGTTIRLSQPTCAPAFAHVLPLGGTRLRRQLDPEATAAVFIGLAPNQHESIEPFAAAYGLTPAEVRVVQALVSGHTLTDAARLIGVGRATAKTQLDSVFQKASIARQGDLIRLVMQFASPIMSAPQMGRCQEPGCGQ